MRQHVAGLRIHDHQRAVSLCAFAKASLRIAVARHLQPDIDGRVHVAIARLQPRHARMCG